MEASEAEKIKKERRCFVKQGTPRLLGTTGHANDLAFQERGHHAIDRDTTHRLNFGASNGLAVRDNGQGLQGWLAEPGSLGRLEKLVRPKSEFRPRFQEKAARHTLNHEA